MAGTEFAIGLSYAAARERIEAAAAAHGLATERVALDAASGRVLVDDVHAPFDVPGFANSAMDGFAVRGADLSRDGETTLRVLATVLAGGAAPPQVTPGTCVGVMTGAPLPPGSDTVVMKEQLVGDATDADGQRIVRLRGGTEPGANVRPAGEDFRAGELALRGGTPLTPARLGALASFGFTQVDVRRRPRAVLLTTGDELVAPGEALAPGQLYDSNRISLGALLAQCGVEVIRHARLRDEPAALRAALLAAADEADLVVTSGGVSAGDADFLPALLAEIGRVLLWKVRIKPGMPFLCGEIGRAMVFSLPGNPVSGIATFLALVRPALAVMARQTEAPVALRARLAKAVHKRHGRVEFLRAHLACDDSGVLRATALPKQGSGMLAGVAQANALIMIPEAPGDYVIDTVVEAWPLPRAFDLSQ